MRAVVVLGLVLVALEALARAYRVVRHGARPFAPLRSALKSVAFESHPYALFVKRPRARGLFPSNALGYAGTREIARNKAPDTVRIYCAGDSTTERHDWREGPDTSWPAQLQDALAPRFPGTRIECINAGASGYTSAEFFAEFAFRGLDLAPDIVLVFPGVNDALTCQMVAGLRPDYSHVRRSRLWMLDALNRIPELPRVWSYQLAREQFLRRFGDMDSILPWISVPPPWRTVDACEPALVAPFRRNVSSLVAVALAHDVVPVLIKYECDWARGAERVLYLGDGARIDALYVDFLNANNAALKEVAARYRGTHYVEVGPFTSTDFSDTIHFNGAGLARMAARVADAVTPIVRSVIAARAGGAAR